MASITLRYGVTFGKCDSSDWIEFDVDVSDEVEEEYKKAKKLRLPLDSDAFESILSDAYDEIEEEEIANGIAYGDEYVLELQGKTPVDADEINDLVAKRDEHTLEFFKLTELTDEELDNWDAYDLDELPDVCDFEEDFVPDSPYDGGWILNVEFYDHPDEDELEEDEARQTLTELFGEANGDYSVILDYVERCEDIYIGMDLLIDLAEEIAEELGYSDFPKTENED